METLACGHAAYPARGRVCPHLTQPDGDTAYLRVLTGDGLAADLSCTGCDAGPPGWEVICEDCVALYDSGEKGYFFGWRGEPGIRSRPEPVSQERAAALLRGEPLLDWTGLPSSDGRSLWLLLDRTGRLIRFDAGSGDAVPFKRRIRAERPPRNARKLPEPRLHTSPDGRYAAIVNDYGRTGQVIDLETGKPTFTFARDGSYEQTMFPAAFTVHEDRVVLLHGTAENRLDVSDAATGRLLTGRAWPGYIHGGLHLSPGGDHIADDGGVPGPAGAPCVWDLRRWLETSGEVPARRELCRREFGIGESVCWVRDDLLAISGIGRSFPHLLAGVRIFSAFSGEEVHAFAGPSGDLLSAGGRLYSRTRDGLEVWEPLTGERIGAVPGFLPSRLHPTTGELAQVRDGFLIRWADG